MRRKWIAGAVALAALGGTAMVATSVFGSGSAAPSRPEYARMTIDLGAPHAALERKASGGGKPKLVYLRSRSPEQINPNDPSAGGVGPYVDLALKGCKRVVDGGVFPSSTDVYVQGTYVKSPSEYHVLLGLDDAAANASPRAGFDVTSNLTCLKGAK